MSYGPEQWAHFLDDLEDDGDNDGPHLISVDELRAAGALDVPAEWRKSLGEKRRFLLAGFDDDDDTSESAMQADASDDENDDENS